MRILRAWDALWHAFRPVVSDSCAKGSTPISAEALSFGSSYPEEMEERTGTGEWITVCGLRSGGIRADVAGEKVLKSETRAKGSSPTRNKCRRCIRMSPG